MNSYPAFVPFPAVAGTTSPIRYTPDAGNGGSLRVTLAGTAFTVRVQVSNERATGGIGVAATFNPTGGAVTLTDAQFVPSTWDNFATVVAADPPLTIPGPIRYIRLLIDSGQVDGGTIQEDETRGPPADARVLALATSAGSTAGTAAGTTAGTAAIGASIAPLSLTLTGTVNGATYGCVEGANVSTIMATIAAAPDGSTIVIPKGNYTHTGGRLMLTGRNKLKIYMNGSTVKATATLADPSAGQNGGFYFVACTEIDVYDGTYDGSLDTRTPFGSDAANTNMKSGWNILNGCNGVRLHNVKGLRCMMDGIYVGHLDNTITGQPAVTQANMPIGTVLDRCVFDGNYRQGLSVVGCNGLTGQGNRFHNTGKTAGKGTNPMAGVDFEGFTPNGWVNLGIDLTDTECNGNVGHAVLFENGTDGAVMRGIKASGNGGGLAFADSSMNCEALSINLSSGGTLAGEPINIVLSGTNNHVRGGTVACLNGTRAGVIKAAGFLCGLHDLTSTSAAGALHTGTFMEGGSESHFDNLTVVDARQTIAGYGVVDMRGTGSRLSGQTRVVGYTNDATSIPVVITQGSATQPSISGYSQPADLRVTGTRLPAQPGLTFIRSAGRAFSIGTVTATLESSAPDRLVYRLSASITTVSGPEAFGVVALSGYTGVLARILNASASDAGTGAFYGAGVGTQSFTANFAATPSTVQGIVLILVVELTR